MTLTGERRPSEIKITRIGAESCDAVLVEHEKPHHGPGLAHPDVPADPVRVFAAVTGSGWTFGGEPRRKPQHFEVLAHKGGDAWTELHVDVSGKVYKRKPADPAKWNLPG